MNEFKIEKVDMAMATLSQLPSEERNVIMDGLREIVKMYAQKDSGIRNADKSVFAWWEGKTKA
jgi:hypothetical protein